MRLNWDLIKRFTDYYVFHGGKLKETVVDLLQGRIATYYDSTNQKIAEERLYPLFESYLRSGLEGKDSREISRLLDFLVDMTRRPSTKLKYGGSKEYGRYLLNGEELNVKASKYDNGWYIESLNFVIEGIQVSIDYLESIKDDSDADSFRADVRQLIEKYTALRDKIESFRNAVPEAQVTIAKSLKPVLDAIQEEQKGNLRLGQLFTSLRSRDERNIFIRIAPNIRIAESIFNNLPRGAKVPSIDDQTAARIIPRRDAYAEIKALTNVKHLREECLSLRDKIDADIAEKQRYAAEAHDDTAELQSQLDGVSKQIQAVDMEIEEVFRQYQNGILAEKQFVLKSRLKEQQKNSLQEKHDRLEKRIGQRSFGESIAAQQKKLYEIQGDMWSDIKGELNPILENPTEARNLIRYFKPINEALFTFAEYINGFASSLQKGNRIDLENVKATLRSLVDRIKKQIEFARGNEKTIEETIYGETMTELANETDNIAMEAEALKRKYSERYGNHMPNGALGQSPTEAFRPNANLNDPLAGIPNGDEPSDEENPAQNPLGIRKRPNNN